MYVKLETFLAQSFSHKKEAIDRYVLGKSKGHTHKTRREDNQKNKQKFYNSNSLNTSLVKKLSNTRNNNSNLDSMKFYNEFVRSSNELFIPSIMINKILTELSKANTFELAKEIKKFKTHKQKLTKKREKKSNNTSLLKGFNTTYNTL